jgi:transcriptional regulator with XRE-family HTH domain
MSKSINDNNFENRKKEDEIQRELAKKFGIKESTLPNIEIGKSNLSYELLVKIAEEFKIDLKQRMDTEIPPKVEYSPPKDVQMFLSEALLEREIEKGDQIISDYCNRFSHNPPKWFESLKSLLIRETEPFLEKATIFIKMGDPRFNIFIIYWITIRAGKAICSNEIELLRKIDQELDLWEFMIKDREEIWEHFLFSIQNMRKSINILICHYRSLEIDNMLSNRFEPPSLEEIRRLDEILPKDNIPDPAPTLRDFRIGSLHHDQDVGS